ncbi:MAG TPA: PDZ domain-containing protein [Acidobacteriota bacterium]|nr:PDZ domain-containing protein [Acidobacteriota bacterium]
MSLQAQGPGPGPGPGKHIFLSEDGTARIPFAPDLGYVVFAAKVNGKANVRLILDTGMPMPGLIMIGKGNKDQLGMNFVAEMPVPGDPGNQEPLMASVAQGVSLSLPGLELTDLSAIVEPEAGNLGAMLGDDDGIIGFELFSQFTITIDFDKYEIILVEPDKFQMPPNAEVLPLLMRNGLPFLKCSAEMVGGAVAPMELVVDLGASHAVSLNVGTHEAIVPPDNSIETLLGKTVSGPIYGEVGRINTLRLGDLELHGVMSSFQTGPRHGPSAMEKHGNLGNGVLRRFNVTFDYRNKRMILVPNSHFAEPFEYNMSGIEFSKTDEGTLKVERILPGSPAEEAQLSPGDVIHSINGRPLGEIGRDELRRILREKGAVVRLSLSSPTGITREVALALRRVI